MNITGSRKGIRDAVRNGRGETGIAACILIVAVIMTVSVLMTYAGIKIECINIKNGAKMELNNLSAAIYADTYRSQREADFTEYLNTLYSDEAYTEMLEDTVREGLASKIPLSTERYDIRDIRLRFETVQDRVKYVFTCRAEFHISAGPFGMPPFVQDITLTGYHNTVF